MCVRASCSALEAHVVLLNSTSSSYPCSFLSVGLVYVSHFLTDQLVNRTFWDQEILIFCFIFIFFIS